MIGQNLQQRLFALGQPNEYWELLFIDWSHQAYDDDVYWYAWLLP